MIINKPGTRFFLMRHAKTLWNEQKRMQGKKDIPLSNAGKLEAHQWADKLKHLSFDRILSSPYKRALETATIINEYLKIDMTVDDRLKEQDLGDWEGKKIKDIQPEAKYLLEKIGGDGWKFCPPQGEHRLSVVSRAKEVLIQLGLNKPDENILVISHQGPIKFLIYNILQRRYTIEEPKIIYPNNVHSLLFKNFNLNIESLNFLSLSH